MKLKVFFLFVFFAAINFSQPLRRNVVSLATGYVSGDNSLKTKNSSQYLLWGKFTFQSLDEISAVYKKFSFNENGEGYNENYFAVKGKINMFPFYASASFGKLHGLFKPRDSYPDAKADFYAGNFIYYSNLIFYEFAFEYVKIQWQTEEKVYTGEIKTTWRPTKYFAASVAALGSQSDYDSLYGAISFEFFWQPLDFFNFTFKKYFGQHRYYYDAEYMVLYSFPYTEKGSESLYLRFFPWKKLSVILNYERRNYDLFNVEYYSASLRYDFFL